MFGNNWRQQMFETAKACAKERGIKITTLGGIIVNDADFFPKIKAGKNVTTDTCEKVMAWFEENFSKGKRGSKANCIEMSIRD